MVKKLILFFIVFAALEVFNLSILGSQTTKVIQLFGIGLMFIIAIIQFLYQKEVNFKMNYKNEIILIFIGLGLSMFMAKWGHDQSINTTFIAQRFIYFYVIYWVLHSIKIPPMHLEDIILWTGVLFSMLYVIQFIMYPAILFEVRIADDRGTLRIFLPGFSFLVLAYFLLLNRLFQEFSIGKLFVLFFFFSIFILMGTRQVIFTIILLTVINIIYSRTVRSKLLILTLMAIGVIPIIYMFQEIFISLIDLSKQQSESITDNVRIRAAVFFLVELFPNTASYITGNGADSNNSNYGYIIQMYRDAYGFYQSDIGIIGDYTRFGLAFTIGAFIILYRTIFSKTSDQSVYIKFFFLSVLLTLFTGGGPFAQADSIVAICFTLYILDVDYHQKVFVEIEESAEFETQFT